MYNIGSLILGLAAWVIPLLALGKKDRFVLCCIGSLSCCSVSLLLQLLEIRRRVELSDWSALMDTTDAVVLAAVLLICGLFAINCIALFGVHRTKR